MDLDLSDNTALVTGAGRGNGRAIVTELADLGASVVVNDLETDPVERVAAEINESEGGEAVAVTADVRDEAEVEEMVETGTDALGGIDVLVNNAGVGDAGPFLDSDPDTIRDRFELNLGVHLWRAINCLLATVNGMINRGYGKVINVTSVHTGSIESAEGDGIHCLMACSTL